MSKNWVFLASCVVVLGLVSSASAVDDFESYWSSGDLAQNWPVSLSSGDVGPDAGADVTLLTGGYGTVTEGSQAMAVDFHAPGGWKTEDPNDTGVWGVSGVTFTPRTPIDCNSFGPDMKFVFDMRVYDVSTLSWYLIEWTGRLADGSHGWAQTWIPPTALAHSQNWANPAAFVGPIDLGLVVAGYTIIQEGEWGTVTIDAEDVTPWSGIGALTDYVALETFSIQFWSNLRDDGTAYDGPRLDGDGNENFAALPNDNRIDIDNIRVVVQPAE